MLWQIITMFRLLLSTMLLVLEKLLKGLWLVFDSLLKGLWLVFDALKIWCHSAFRVLRDSGRLLKRPLLVFGLLWVLFIIGGGSSTIVLIVFGIVYLVLHILIVKCEDPAYSFRREALALIKKGVKKLCILFVAVVLKVCTVLDAKVLSKMDRVVPLKLFSVICVSIGLVILQKILRSYPLVTALCISGISGIIVCIITGINFTIMDILDDYGIFDSFKILDKPGQNDPRFTVAVVCSITMIITFIIIIIAIFGLV